MQTRFINIWYAISSSLWFLPALLTLLAGGLAIGTIMADQSFSGNVIGVLGPLGTMGPHGARALLSTVAGSVISIAGVAFSITIVALTLASSQFGPRLLRTFMKNKGNQLVLGIFIATFVYSLLVMGAIRDVDHQLFVPIVSVLCSLVFALVSLGAFIYFIHNVSTSIHADNVVFAISKDLNRAIDRMVARVSHRQQGTHTSPEEAVPAHNRETSQVILCATDGYLQAIDFSCLVTLAQAQDITIKVLHRPGDFVMKKHSIVTLWPAKELTEAVQQKVNQAFIVGAQRTEEQDLEYAIHQMVELALRALSPGINDPFTAISCIDWLGAAINRLAEQGLPKSYYYDDRDDLRVIADVPEMAGVFDAAFSQIRQHGSNNMAIILRLLETFRAIALGTDHQEAHQAIRRHADMVYGVSLTTVTAESDKKDVEKRYQEVVKAVHAA